jgi:hypothetical protein
MLGLFDQNNGADLGDFKRAIKWRNDLLRFIHTGTPDPYGDWPNYGRESRVKVATSPVEGPPFIHRDFFDNRRCLFWAEEGYLRLVYELQNAWLRRKVEAEKESNRERSRTSEKGSRGRGQTGANLPTSPP